MPGLVDAHCHLGLDAHGAVDDETTEQQALADRDAGSLLLRDCGSPADTRWVHDRDDLPRLIRCGRHLARTRRYIRNFAHEIEPGDLTTYAAQEARAGDGWIKLVGDWISREEGDLAPSFPAEAFAAAIATAHEHGARVTAHCFGEAVLPGLIEAGIDCIEHGTGLTTDLVETMAARGTALVPTADQLNNFPMYAEAGCREVPGVRRPHARPARASTRDDHGRLRGGSRDLRRHRRRGRAAPRTDRRRGDRARVVRHAGGVRPGRRQLAGARVARAGTPGSTRVRRRTSWSTPATRARTSRCSREPTAVVLRGQVV